MSDKPERPPYNVKVAETKDEWEACYDQRVEVFVVEQGFDLDDEIDEHEPNSTNFLLTVQVPSPPSNALESLIKTPTESPPTNKPIGTIRFTPAIGKVSRLAVTKDYRKYGFGVVLMNSVEEHLQSCGRDILKDVITEKEGKEIVTLKLHSQMQVIPFYEKCGYRAVGEVFDEDGAPHQKMIKEVELQ